MKIKVLDCPVKTFVKVITTQGVKYISVERAEKYYRRGDIHHVDEYKCFTTMGPDDPLLKEFGRKN